MSWAPFNSIGGQAEDGSPIRRLVTGSCDNVVRIWRSVGLDGPWEEESKLTNPHSDWVRDVAWAPNTAMPFNTIASCSEDRTLVIWKQTPSGSSSSGRVGVAGAGGGSGVAGGGGVGLGLWEPQVVKTFDAPVWRVSWSVTGNVLAVSTGDHKVTLWKQSVDETWTQISAIGEA